MWFSKILVIYANIQNDVQNNKPVSEESVERSAGSGYYKYLADFITGPKVVVEPQQNAPFLYKENTHYLGIFYIK